ncbi:hypothetical protein [Paractinoplanes bogorensis]|nr:hypothetical protein [Actinoplanes bogorensis]
MGSIKVKRTAAALAAVALVGFAAACGGGDDTTSAAEPGTAAEATAAAKAPGKGNAEMLAACADVRKMFAALDGGDQATAKSLMTSSYGAFKKITDANDGKDPQLASNAEAMWSILDELPVAPIHESIQAEVYGIDCVRQYGAPALQG